MKRLLGILVVLCCIVFFYGINIGRYGNTDLSGNYTFQDSITFTDDVVHTGTVTFAPGWMEFDQLKPATNDSASSSIGTSTNPFALGYFGKICSIYRNTNIVWTSWGGGAIQLATDAHYYASNGANDTLYTQTITLPDILTGNDVRIDSLFLNVYTQGNEDSVKIVLQSVASGSPVGVDSVRNVGGGVSGWVATNVINTPINPAVNTGYRLKVGCQNDGDADIRVELFVRVVWSSK